MKSLDAFNLYILKLHTQTLRKQDGQGALEYIGIVVGLVVLIAIGFQIAGVQILEKARTFVQEVINAGTPKSTP